jgi:transposase
MRELIILGTASQGRRARAHPTAGHRTSVDTGSPPTSCTGVPCASLGISSNSNRPLTWRSGRKRHIVTDTCGLLLAVAVTGANVQDRDAARLLLWALRSLSPAIGLVWADSGSTGQLVDWAATTLALTVQIVAKLAGQTTFIVLPRRWCVERTFSWINRCRRTVRDYERLPQHHAAMIQWAMIALMTRRLAPPHLKPLFTRLSLVRRTVPGRSKPDDRTVTAAKERAA